MKTRGVLAIILITCWFGIVPATAHDCCHHDQHYADFNDCNHDCDHGGAQGSRHCCDWTPTGGATDLRTAEGQRYFREHDLLHKTCVGCVQTVVEELAELLDEEQPSVAEGSQV